MEFEQHCEVEKLADVVSKETERGNQRDKHALVVCWDEVFHFLLALRRPYAVFDQFRTLGLTQTMVLHPGVRPGKV